MVIDAEATHTHNPMKPQAQLLSLLQKPQDRVLRTSRYVLLFILSCARADVVVDFNNAALDAIRSDKTPPPKASRALAILHASIFDAVNGITRRSESYLVPSAVPAGASTEAAASAAGYRVLLTLYPAAAASFEPLYRSSLPALRVGAGKSAGRAWRERVGT